MRTRRVRHRFGSQSPARIFTFVPHSKQQPKAETELRPAVSSACLRIHRKIESLQAANPAAVALVERLVDDMLAPTPTRLER
jgi:hypothetical protein